MIPSSTYHPMRPRMNRSNTKPREFSILGEWDYVMKGTWDIWEQRGRVASTVITSYEAIWYLRSSEQLLLGIKPTILWSSNGSLRICWWGKWIFQAWNRDRIGLNPQHVPSNQLDKRHVCCIFHIFWWDTTDIINMIWYGEIPYITDIWYHQQYVPDITDIINDMGEKNTLYI